MSGICKQILGLSLFTFFSLVNAIPAYAGAVQLTSAADLNSVDVTVPYPAGTPFPSSFPAVSLPNPLILNAAGNTLTFSKPTGLFIISTIFPGQLSTGNAFGQFGAPITIDFATGVTELGFLATPNFRLPGFQFSFTAFNGSLALGTFNVATPPGRGSVFLGVRATDADVITRLTVNHSIPDFAIGPVTFGGAAAAPIPEPMTLLLLGTGLVGVGAMVRRRRKASTEA